MAAQNVAELARCWRNECVPDDWSNGVIDNFRRNVTSLLFLYCFTEMVPKHSGYI